jgi:hypothetical protein
MERKNGGGNDSLTPDDFRGPSIEDNRRHEPRFITAKTISIVPCDQNWNMRFHRVHLVDCSLHGLGILSPLRFEPGERFLAKLRISQQMFLSVYCCRNCTPEGQKYKVGAEFTGFISGVGDDPEEILKALVAESYKT